MSETWVNKTEATNQGINISGYNMEWSEENNNKNEDI